MADGFVRIGDVARRVVAEIAARHGFDYPPVDRNPEACRLRLETWIAINRLGRPAPLALTNAVKRDFDGEAEDIHS